MTYQYICSRVKNDIAAPAEFEKRYALDRSWLARHLGKTDGTPIGPGPYGTPTAWFENGTWYLFYQCGDQGGWLATSRDLKTWTNVKDDPVLARGPDSYDATAVALIKSSSAGRITMPSTMPMPSGPGPTGRRMSPARATWCTGRYTQLDSGEKN